MPNTPQQNLQEMFADHEQRDKERFMEVQSTITDLYESIPGHIDASIKKSVNGNIKALDEKVSKHMAEVEPYLKGAAGVGIISKLVLYMGSIAAAVIAIIKVWEVLHGV